MVKGSQKSRTFRRIFKKLPGGTTVMRYARRKPSKAHCAGCRDVLKGVPRELPYKMQNIPKTKKRPERPYGGVLCTKCLRAKMVALARA